MPIPVSGDPTGTHLASLKSGIENLVHSSDMGCLACMQGLTGYYNQLEFPTSTASEVPDR